MSAQQSLKYGSESELEDITGTYLPGNPEDYEITVEGVSERKRNSKEPTEQLITYEAENDLGQGSMFTVTWTEGERTDLVFDDDPIDYLEEN